MHVSSCLVCPFVHYCFSPILFFRLFGLFVRLLVVFFVKHKTASEMRISDWSSDVCSSDLFGTFDNLDREVRSLQRAAPDATEELERRDDEIGSAMRDLELSARVENFLEVLDDRVGSGSDALAENALTIPVFFVNAILTIYLLIYGAGIVEGGLGLIGDDERQARTRRVLLSATLRARRPFATIPGPGQ